MTIMMDHGYTLIVVLIIRTSSTTNTTMYIHPGLVANSIAIRKLMPICIRIRIRIPMFEFDVEDSWMLDLGGYFLILFFRVGSIKTFVRSIVIIVRPRNTYSNTSV